MPSIFSEIYSSGLATSASAGNSTILASDLALLGVKYLVFQGSWGGPYVAEGLAKPTSSFQFVMQDGNVSLYRNLLFGHDNQLPNLILDPGFETLDNIAWQPWNSSNTNNCTLACFVNGTSFEGSSSLKEVDNNTNYVAGRSQIINASSLAPGRYAISGWSSALNVSYGSEYGLRVLGVYQNGTDATLAFAPFRTGTHEWQYSSAIFSVGAFDGLNELILSTYLRSGTGTAWVDDLSLDNITPAANNWAGFFAVKSVYQDSSSMISQSNLVSSSSNWTKTSSMKMELDVDLSQSAFIVLPISKDPGWVISSSTTGETVPLEQYAGLLGFQLSEGKQHLQILYSAYQDSLSRTFILYSLGVALACTVLVLRRKSSSSPGVDPIDRTPNHQSPVDYHAC